MDEALCFGWIDSIRKTVDEASYTNRFTPRSTWSAVNIKRAEELIRQGRMRPAGLKALEARSETRSGIYSYEQRKSVKLTGPFEQRFKQDEDAWTFFLAQPPSYRTMATFWVMSAKKDETREKRLATLIEDSARGRTVPPLTRPTRRLKSKRGEQGD
ncbi:MAG: YdeI/OmpD-associated family protein [Actinomycetota bacterium]